MAVVVQSTSTDTSAGASTVITKPTGLAVGDLMVAHITSYGLNTIVAIDIASGWTETTSGAVLDSGTSTGVRQSIQYKVATSGDVAATDFTFTAASTGGRNMIGAMYRIDGQNSVTPIDTSNAASAQNGGTPFSGNATVTPTYANSLLLFFASGYDASAFNTYTVATSNPTWTENYDFTATASMAGATATRPEVTATGNAGVSFTNAGSGDVVVGIVVVRPIVSVSTSPSVVTLTANLGTPTITTQTRIAANPFVLNMTQFEASVAGQPTIDNREPKTTSSFSNLSKTSTTFTNSTSKTSATWTSQAGLS